MSKSELQCSFCGKKKNQTSLLIAGIDAHICDMCIEQANGIILQESQTRSESIPKKSNNELLKPQQIKLFLDDYIIGQDYTKKVISVSVYNHYKRLNQEVENDVEIEKSNYNGRSDRDRKNIDCKNNCKNVGCTFSYC